MQLGKGGDSAVAIVLVHFSIFLVVFLFNPIAEKAKLIADDVVVANGEESATNTP